MQHFAVSNNQIRPLNSTIRKGKKEIWTFLSDRHHFAFHLWNSLQTTQKIYFQNIVKFRILWAAICKSLASCAPEEKRSSDDVTINQPKESQQMNSRLVMLMLIFKISIVTSVSLGSNDWKDTFETRRNCCPFRLVDWNHLIDHLKRFQTVWCEAYVEASRLWMTGEVFIFSHDVDNKVKK